MKKSTKVNIRNLRGLIRKTSFNNGGGMFIPYHFIAIAIDGNGKPYFYESVQVSRNSWTNYPGQKIWHNGNEAIWSKDAVLSRAMQNLEVALKDLVESGEIEDYEIID